MSLTPPPVPGRRRVARALAALATWPAAALVRAQMPTPSAASEASATAPAAGVRPCTAAGNGSAAAFIVGADVSTLEAVEQAGGRFADAQGRAADALGLLRQGGFDWGRLRLWHTPVNAEDVVDQGHLVSRRGQPVGGGSNDLALTIRLAKRLQAAGMKWLLDIHYSDFWADPAHQRKPQAWRGLRGEALAQAVQHYTREVLLQLHAAGVPPDMVQLGNETNGGFLWPDGKTWRERPDEAIGGHAGYQRLLQAATEGLREAERATGRHFPVMLHLAHQGDGRSLAVFEDMFDRLQAAGARVDVIGLSWYPYYHDPLPALRRHLQHLAQRYGKPLVVVETAYGFQLDNPAGGPAIFNAEGAARSGWPASPQGQADMLRAVATAVAQTPGGLGVFYWEPAWLGVPGVGWRTNDGNGWANQALFDARGRALPGLGALRAAANAVRPCP